MTIKQLNSIKALLTDKARTQKILDLYSRFCQQFEKTNKDAEAGKTYAALRKELDAIVALLR